MQPILNYIKHPARLCDSIVHTFGQWLPDRIYIKLRYRFSMGKKLDLDNPRTFQEKLQWLKIHDRRPEYSWMVDKIDVKDFVASRIGAEFVVPILGVWDRPEEIEWDALPDRFVLKTNHSGGNTGVIICKDKKTFNKERAIAKLNASLRFDVYRHFREWPYKNVKKRVFAEQFIECAPNVEDLPDYKFFCFNGEVKALFVATERQIPNEEVKFDFFDSDYNPLPFRQGHDHARVLPQKPESFEQMKRLATILSKDIPHVRVDFYEVNGKPIFGELTFYHFGGMVRFEPEEWDYKFGEWLVLPYKDKIR